VENFLLVTLIANTNTRWTREGAVTAVALVLVGIGAIASLEWAAGRPLLVNAGRIAYETRFGVLQTFEGARRLGSVLLNPDLLAAAMVLGFVVWTGIALEKRGLLRWIALFVAAGLLWVALLTVSRTVFLGVPVGLGVLLAFSVGKGRASIGQAAVAMTGVCAAAFVALALVPNAWLRISTDVTDPLRVGGYETAVRIITAHPLAGLGAGWNRYYALADQYRALDQSIPLAHPHNSFLELAAMLGLPVAIAVVLLVGQAFSDTLRHTTRTAVSPIPVAGMTVMIVMSLVGDPITIPVLSNLFWALWAVAGRSVPERIHGRAAWSGRALRQEGDYRANPQPA
jgi:O-antigen ligase